MSHRDEGSDLTRDRILSPSANYYESLRQDTDAKKERRGRRKRKERWEGKHRLGGQFSSVHYRRSRVAHVRLEKHVLKPVSPDRFREPNLTACARITDPGTHTTTPRPSAPSSSSSSTSPLSFTAFTSRLFQPPMSAAGSSDFREARMWAGPDSRLPTPYFRR